MITEICIDNLLEILTNITTILIRCGYHKNEISV